MKLINIGYRHSLESTQPGDSNEHKQSLFEAEIRKIAQNCTWKKRKKKKYINR